MIKNSVTYRRLWYVKRRNIKSLNILLKLVSIIIISILIATYFEKKLLPYLMEISEFKVKTLITEIVSNTVNNTFGENTGYEDLAVVSRDKNNHITSIQMDMFKINRLSADISGDIAQKLSLLKKESVAVPFGVLLGKVIFANLGPDLLIKIQPCGNVETDFKSEFSDAGTNQTRYRIFLQVKTTVGVTIPLMKKKCELITSIPITETVIVGSTDSAS